MMKTAALVLFVLTSLALGGLLVQEKQRTTQQTARAADLQSQVTRQHEEIQKATAAAAQLEQKRAQLAARNKATKQALADAQDAAATAAAQPVAAVSPAPGSSSDQKKKSANPFADSIKKMMKDPAMKNMIRASQGTALKQMYGDLVKRWSLSPEETQTFYDLLLDKQMDQMDQGMNLLEKGPDAAAASPTDPDAKLKASLGDNLYKQYQEYEKTIAGRFTVNQFQQQLAVNNVPAMTPDQSAVLLQAVSDEKMNIPPDTFGQASGQNGSGFSMTPERVDQFVKAQSDLNDRVDLRMAATLSAEQLKVLKEQQQQMLATQRMGMEMAAKIMAPSPTP